LGSAAALPSPVRADETRSGTILTGTEPSANAEWHTLRDLGCHAAVDCVAWITSGCDPALAGMNPGVQSSIVDVSDLADGTTTRVFSSRSAALWGGDYTVVQFWNRRTAGGLTFCTEVPNSKSSEWHCWNPSAECRGFHERALRVPVTANWMTVTTARDSVHTTWTLT